LWIGVIFNIILDIILIRYYDYTGAVVATGLGFMIMTSLTYNHLRKKTTIRIDYKQQLKILTAGALFLSVAMFLESLIFITIGKLSVVVEGAIVFLTSGSLYVIALVLFKVITKTKIIYLKNLIFKSDNNLESINQ